MYMSIKGIYKALVIEYEDGTQKIVYDDDKHSDGDCINQILERKKENAMKNTSKKETRCTPRFVK